MGHLNAQLQHVPDVVILNIRDRGKSLIDARLFDHPDDRYTEPVVGSEYLNAAAALVRADLRPMIAEELIKASTSIGIESLTPSGRNHPAEIARCP